ncbi:MAG: transposase [Planctomycetales bacterium]|nr:transposase [Planctomycetales bacterium]
MAYEIYRYRNQFGRIDGVLGRSEFGMEIVLALAYQVYCVGLSIDKACQVLCFFQQLDLKKSQADRLLNHLARAWETEFESLCTILANSAVVHCDETSWSINSVWAFLNKHVTVKQVKKFTLTDVIAEVQQWMIRGKSCFQKQAAKAKRQTPKGILDRLILQADASP